METRNVQNGPERPAGTRRPWLVASVALVILAAVVISGVVPRVRARATVRFETNQLAVPAVVVVQPKHA
ncbi:MAG TPA: hypothetical protein VK466_13140, partial [Terriglobales bacterium]|nr:hypothetical protein [Terriglobales bacterium]